MIIFSWGVQHVYCAKFMLTVFYNGNNPIITKIMSRDKKFNAEMT